MYPGTLKEAKVKFSAIKKAGSSLRNVQTVVCPPFPYVGDLLKMVGGHRVVLGAQNAWTENEGAFTGEVSPSMLVSLGLKHIILGHSERRALGETDELVNKKVITALKSGAIVVLCVGEKERDMDGAYLKDVAAQVRAGLRGAQKKDLQHVVVAYEPLWAIGKNAQRAATAEDALEVSISIKKVLADMFGTEAEKVKILYGGSVDAKNAADFLKRSRVDGLLVGRASLDVNIFSAILKGADAIK